MTVRTRFAPSPTGMLHIGGARTALFNYLFSRHHGGEFLLRIEDTDKARSTAAATQVILEGLAWLGLETDAPPVFQSTRAARHAEVARQMVAAGSAYRCWLSAEELKAMRAADPNARVRSPWRDRDPAEGPAGVAPSIRIRAPREGETVVDDLVQGIVRVGNAELDDMIILRSDGTPTYQHAVVVDDHDMAITHVIRGDDHLTNTFRQVQIYDAMGWARPFFAHVPLIHGADGHKLSKRHGAVSVLEFQEQGYLPEAVCNYLMRLGWAHGDLEVISREEAVRVFDVDGSIAGVADGLCQAAARERGVDAPGRGWAADGDGAGAAGGARGLVLDDAARGRIAALMPELKGRAKTLGSWPTPRRLARPLPLTLDAKAEAVLTGEARAMLREVADAMGATDFGREALEWRAARLRRGEGAEARPGGAAAAAALTGTLVSRRST